MKMRLIQAPNMKKAMMQIQEELGPDALIYNTRKGLSGVEVVAGVPTLQEDAFEAVENTFSDGEPDAEASPMFELTIEKRLSDIDQGMRELSEAMTRMAMPKNMLGVVDETRLNHQKYLKRLGFSDDMINMLFLPFIKKEKNTDDLVQNVNHWIAKTIALPDQELANTGGIAALVGPTGAGKTTTIIKIASRFLRNHHADEIGIITTDVESIYIKNKLSHFCDLYHVDFEYVNSSSEMQRTLNAMRHKKLILIDTHGISQRNQYSIASLKSILERSNANIQVFLTLACSQQELILEEVVEKFAWEGIAGCILTKADECIQITPALSIAMKHYLEIMYICNGQDLELDITHPTKSSIMHMLPIAFHDEHDYAPPPVEAFSLRAILSTIGARLY